MYKNIKVYQLFDGDGGGYLSPEPSELDGGHKFLGVSVYMSVEHEATERGPEVKGQRLIHHAEEDEFHIQLLGYLVYRQILTVQTHSSKELQLVPDEKITRPFTTYWWGLHVASVGVFWGDSPVVCEDIFIMSVSLSCFLGELSNALLLSLVGFISPHQPDLNNRTGFFYTMT